MCLSPLELLPPGVLDLSLLTHAELARCNCVSKNLYEVVEVSVSAEIRLICELTGEFDLGSEPIVFVSMSSIRNWYQV